MTAERRGESTRVLLAGGGTGGHVFPGLAVAEELGLLDEDVATLFVGSPGGIEERLVPAAGRELRLVASVKTAGLGGYLKLPFAMCRAYAGARRILNGFAADVVVALGGYASLAPALAAWRRGIPVVVLEQNAIPGRVSRLLARFAAEVHATYEESVGKLDRGARVAVSGNPVRRIVIDAGARRQERQEGQGGEKQTLLVAGGSQGARGLNEVVLGALGLLAHLGPDLRVVHLCGPGNYDSVAARAKDLALDVEVIGFEKDMAARYAQSDLIVSRAGATALAEIAVCGLPALLVPYPHAKDNHQEANARAFEAAGGAEVLLEAGLNAEKLAGAIEGLVRDGAKRARMSEGMRTRSRPGAGAVIAGRILELAGRNVEL